MYFSNKCNKSLPNRESMKSSMLAKNSFSYAEMCSAGLHTSAQKKKKRKEKRVPSKQEQNIVDWFRLQAITQYITAEKAKAGSLSARHRLELSAQRIKTRFYGIDI